MTSTDNLKRKLKLPLPDVYKVIWSKGNRILSTGSPENNVLLNEKLVRLEQVVTDLFSIYNSNDVDKLPQLYDPNITFTSTYVGKSHPFKTLGKPYTPVCATGLSGIQNAMDGWHTALPDLVFQVTKVVIEEEGVKIMVYCEFNATPVYTVDFPKNLDGTCDGIRVDSMVTSISLTPIRDHGIMELELGRDNKIIKQCNKFGLSAATAKRA